MNNTLYHHGINGQKWGVRRFQNEDGSLTSSGRKRYGVEDKASTVKSITSKGSKRKQKTNRELRYEIERTKLKKELHAAKYENVNNALKGEARGIANLGKSAISSGSKFVAKTAPKAMAYLQTPNGKKLVISGAVFIKTKSKVMTGLTYMALSKHYKKKEHSEG